MSAKKEKCPAYDRAKMAKGATTKTNISQNDPFVKCSPKDSPPADSPEAIWKLIREARNAYFREYQRANPDKVKRYQRKYWLSKMYGKKEAERLVSKLDGKGGAI